MVMLCMCLYEYQCNSLDGYTKCLFSTQFGQSPTWVALRPVWQTALVFLLMRKIISTAFFLLWRINTYSVAQPELGRKNFFICVFRPCFHPCFSFFLIPINWQLFPPKRFSPPTTQLVRVPFFPLFFLWLFLIVRTANTNINRVASFLHSSIVKEASSIWREHSGSS